MIRSSSNGGMIARPRSAAISSATRWRSSLDGPDDDDLGAVGLDPRPLERRRVRRHDDDRRRAEQPGGAGDALGVVARRVRDDAAGALRGAQRRDRDVRAADLERADRLERLGLEEAARLGWPERARAASGSRRRGGSRPRPGSPRCRRAAQSPRRSAHPPRPTIRWQSMQWAAHGRASSRSGAIGRPQRTHVPNVPHRAGRAPPRRLQMLLVLLAQGEVALLLEDLAGRGCLRAVGHRVRARRSPSEPDAMSRSRSAIERLAWILRLGHPADRTRAADLRPNHLSSKA